MREKELDQRVEELNRTLIVETPTDEMRDELRAASSELDGFRNEMSHAHPSFGRGRVDGTLPETWPDAWRSLAVVEYVAGEKSTIAFVMTLGTDGKRAVRAVRIAVTHEELTREANQLAELVAKRAYGYRASARRLYDLLLAPLEPSLAAYETICVIPDDVLWNVPFQALLAPNGKPVVDRHAVFYAQSLVLLAKTVTRTTETRPRLLAFGNPTVGAPTRATFRSLFRDRSLGSLEDAETEVRALARMYSPERSLAFYGREAREDVAKKEAQSFDILHFAAHAMVDDRAPMYSSIVLAAGPSQTSEDGLLEAREIVDLPLRAELAVLSACDTARGKLAGSEGVIGLAWAFFAAGCPTTVVSQWKADSRATSLLMIEFHRRLLAGDSTAAALRHAQLALRRNPEYAHPFYWAPFVAIGAAQRGVGGLESK
ncbi:MAG TPA: CHAT domain-containing protein [Thermoanaerobaculia bacterium]|nr:CHAT domain-containing protein [Thermoanaerobaculia bacterium]